MFEIVLNVSHSLACAYMAAPWYLCSIYIIIKKNNTQYHNTRTYLNELVPIERRTMKCRSDINPLAAPNIVEEVRYVHYEYLVISQAYNIYILCGVRGAGVGGGGLTMINLFMGENGLFNNARLIVVWRLGVGGRNARGRPPSSTVCPHARVKVYIPTFMCIEVCQHIGDSQVNGQFMLRVYASRAPQS